MQVNPQVGNAWSNGIKQSDFNRPLQSHECEEAGNEKDAPIRGSELESKNIVSGRVKACSYSCVVLVYIELL